MNHTYKGEELSLHHLKARMRVNRGITPFEWEDVVTIDYYPFYKSACESSPYRLKRNKIISVPANLAAYYLVHRLSRGNADYLSKKRS